MTDQELIKRLRLQSEHIPVRTLFDDAADRIEELEAHNKDLALQLLATSGQAADALDKLTECEARLGKAVESIKQSIKLWEKPDGGDRLGKLDNAYDGFELLCKALAKLEGSE